MGEKAVGAGKTENKPVVESETDSDVSELVEKTDDCPLMRREARPAENNHEKAKEPTNAGKNSDLKKEVVNPVKKGDEKTKEDVENQFILPNQVKISQDAVKKSLESPNKSAVERIYSSLPPDLNVQVMARVTSTSPTGYNFLVKRDKDDKLRICYQNEMPVAPRYIEKEPMCIACQRKIEGDELYLNFPDDLDRRRLWGSALGFKYNEILRMKANTGFSVTSQGCICTDHFSEECFRKYNFNKAAIECFGMPIHVPSSSPTTPVKKSSPWECSVCLFRCLSVYEMHEHLSNHAAQGKDDKQVRNMLQDKGITCPFCRRCTYGYKTLSGFKRHLQVEPLAHFYLKRIHEIATKNCRSACLNPVNEWPTWTEGNVFYAYHGCDIPAKSPAKRVASTPVTPQAEGKKAKVDEEPRTAPTAARKLYVDKNALLKVNEASIEMSTHYANRIKAILSPGGEEETTEEVVVESTQNLAQALRTVTEEDGDYDEEAIYQEDIILPQSVHRDMLVTQRKTIRQLESNEARLRLFGEGDVPRGYKKVDGPNGPRLVPEKTAKTWRDRFAPDVQIRNPRFLPLH